MLIRRIIFVRLWKYIMLRLFGGKTPKRRDSFAFYRQLFHVTPKLRSSRRLQIPYSSPGAVQRLLFFTCCDIWGKTNYCETQDSFNGVTGSVGEVDGERGGKITQGADSLTLQRRGDERGGRGSKVTCGRQTELQKWEILDIQNIPTPRSNPGEELH